MLFKKESTQLNYLHFDHKIKLNSSRFILIETETLLLFFVYN